MSFNLSDLIDVEKTRKLLENFSSAVGVSAAIIDLEGTVLVSSPWQRICSDFHRQNEVTCRRCIESDTVLASELLEGKTFSLYRCLNGLTDAASPIIIEGQHLANAFIGQFFIEKPDLEFFRGQAKEFGFDESAYLAALSEAPLVAKETLPSILSFLTSFAEMTASLGLRQLRQLEAEKELREARLKLEIQNEKLQASEQDLNRAQAVAQIGSWRMDVQHDVLHWSDETYRIFGIPKRLPLTYETFLAAVHPDDRKTLDQSWQAALSSGHYNIEHRITVGDTVKWVHERAELEFDERGALWGGFGTVQDITDRKQMIERIESLARFPDENPSPVLRISKQGELLYANKSSSTLLKSMCREPQKELLIDLQRDAMEALSSGSGREIEAVCADIVYSLIFAPLNDLGYVNIYGTDITERRAARAELLRAKEEWERTFDSVPDLIAILDTQHRIVRANREMALRLGVTPKECVGLHCYESVHGLDYPPEFCPHTQTLNDGRQHVVEVYEERLGGDFLVSVTPLLDEKGVMIGTVHVARDITERKQMEDELRRSESQFRLLSETANKLLASEDPQPIVNELCLNVMAHLDCHLFLNFLVNENAGKLHLNACAGISEEEAGKIEWLDFGAAVCGCVARDGEQIVVEDISNTPDIRTDSLRSYGIEAFACHPLKAGDRVIGTLAFGSRTRPGFLPKELDLMKTVADQVAVAMERIRLIEGLRKSRDELELRVEERTEELKTYMAKLEESNQALEDFASIASHDMQEPLRKVVSFGNILRQTYKEALGEKGIDYLNRMIGAANRMESLLKGLLEYSRVTTKADPFVDVELTKIIGEVLCDLEVRIERTGGKVLVGELPVIKGDQTQMRQLFQNLIGNALKFHKDGEKPVIKMLSAITDDDELEIVVEDNGIGFEEKYIDRIFAPFQRLHGRGGPYEGAGLGLAICKKIVERHGGSITARSKPGKGSAFIIRLPAKLADSF